MPPAAPDTEQTWDEVRARIKKVREYVTGFQRSDFEGAETRVVPLAAVPGKGLLAPDYVRYYVLPNFYFHVTHAYAILRHNGVELGKRAYVGQVELRDV